MALRSDRLKLIHTIIENNSITSQDQLLSLLKESGVNVTQATLSRDLKMLRVGKVSGGSNEYIYALPSALKLKESEQQYINDFKRGFLSITFSMNMGVIKTLPGHANSTASAIDHLSFPEILGSIAGDDTIFFVINDKYSAKHLTDSLLEIIPDLEL